MVKRGKSGTAFGRPLSQLGKNLEVIARARVEIEAMRLIVLKAAKAMDLLGNREARVWVSMAKAMVPERVCRIIDQAIQIHGATGIRSEEHTSELQSLMRISYAVFCLKKKKNQHEKAQIHHHSLNTHIEH